MNILGINDGHNSSIALIKNGETIAILEEERFSRIKADFGFPKQSLDYSKKKYPEFMKSIDYVGIATKKMEFYSMATKRYPKFKIKDFLIEDKLYWEPYLSNDKKIDPSKVMKKYVNMKLSYYPLKSLKNKNDFEEINKMRINFTSKFLNINPSIIEFVDHHTCHAHHGFYSCKNKKNSLIFTIDGFGDNTNAAVFTEINNKLKCLYRTNIFNIGRIYSLITLYLGMKPAEHEYKVMGLAPYAREHDIEPILKIFKDTYYIKGLKVKIKNKIKNHYKYFKNRFEELGCRFDAIAGALQLYTEEILINWIKNWLIFTRKKKVILSGGVALNIKACKKISELNNVKQLEVPMGSGDESISHGAAQFMHMKKNSKVKLKGISSPYLGAGYNKNDVLDFKKNRFIKRNFKIIEKVKIKKIAKLLSEGKIIANLRGNSEFGPRALGNRSLLADPRDKKVVKTLNDSIKHRDFWMPFTPSILYEDRKKYFKNKKKLNAFFMTLAFDSTETGKKDILAAIHERDMTLRPQLVKKKINPFYHSLIKEFKSLTGVAALLNTSLNFHGKPIVLKPQDLLKEVIMNKAVELNCVLIEDTLFQRK